MRLRVVTYNIHRAIGRDRCCRPERIAAVLNDIGADIVALQEVASTHHRGGGMLERLADATGMTAVAGYTLREKTGHYGNALLMRRPAASVYRLDIGVPGREPRGLMDVRLTLGGHRLAVLATHLGLRPGERGRQVHRILHHLDTVAADTTVVTGDFNEWLPWGRPLRRLNRRLGSTPAPPTFPAHCPMVAIDRIWIDPPDRLATLGSHATALTRIASDHLPLVADIDLAGFGDR